MFKLPMKIISGGQTGADLGGLVAAKQLGIETGGWMMKGWLTECGPCPDLGKLYNLVEHTSANPKPRTRMNAKHSDGTAWFGTTGSAGYKCTARACDDYEKPFKVIETVTDLKEFVRDFQIRILNIAGNRASHNPRIHRFTAEMIIAAFGDKR